MNKNHKEIPFRIHLDDHNRKKEKQVMKEKTSADKDVENWKHCMLLVGM